MRLSRGGGAPSSMDSSAVHSFVWGIRPTSSRASTSLTRTSAPVSAQASVPSSRPSGSSKPTVVENTSYISYYISYALRTTHSLAGTCECRDPGLKRDFQSPILGSQILRTSLVQIGGPQPLAGEQVPGVPLRDPDLTSYNRDSVTATCSAKEGPRRTPAAAPWARRAMSDNGSYVIYAPYVTDALEVQRGEHDEQRTGGT